MIPTAFTPWSLISSQHTTADNRLELLTRLANVLNTEPTCILSNSRRHATDTLVAQAYGAISEANLKKVYSAVTDVATSAKAVASSVGSVAMGFPSSVESAVAWISVRYNVFPPNHHYDFSRSKKNL
jgi:hypothetical protein